MSGAWKPGDVAVISVSKAGLPGNHRMTSGTEDIRVRRSPENDGWMLPGDEDYYWTDAPFMNARPLVVIDPEDREQVDRLLGALNNSGAFRGAMPHSKACDATQAALRSLITPPKPEEPTGLGAVVLAIHDNHFVHLGGGRWRRAKNDDEMPTYAWGEIDAVQILSDGVQP